MEIICFDENMAITWILKGMSQITDIKPVHCSIIQGTAQTLFSPSSYPAVNDGL